MNNKERKQIWFEHSNEVDAKAKARRLEAALEQFSPVLLHEGLEGTYKVRLVVTGITNKALLERLTLANNYHGTDAVLVLNDKGMVLKDNGYIFVKF
jgi:hypothetical protein